MALRLHVPIDTNAIETIGDSIMGGASNYFQGYQSTLGRVAFTEMLDDHLQKNSKRRLSIVGPCNTHDQWLAAHAERRRTEVQAQETIAADAVASDVKTG